MNQREIGRAAALLANRVAPVYEFLNWQWVGTGIPDEYQIYEEILRLVDSLEMNEADETSCGGIIIRKDNDGNIQMSFEISEEIFV